MVEDMGDFGTGSTPPEPDVTPAPQRSRSKARGAAAGVGVALVVGAGGIAVATSGSPTAAPGASPTTEGATPPPGASGQPHPGSPGAHGFNGRGPGGMGGFGGRGLAGGPVLHGTFVITKTGGGYQTVQEQTGTVDSVTTTTLVVTSKDSFKGTYVVPSGAIVDAQRDGISSVKKGDEVMVSATVSGSTVTITRVEDLTQLIKNRPAFTGGAGPEGGFRGPGGRHTNRGPAAAPASPGTGT